MIVGTTGFEPATPRPPAECSTGLSHVPKQTHKIHIIQLKTQFEFCVSFEKKLHP